MSKSKHSVNDCKTAAEFERAVTHQGGRVRTGGPHNKAQRADGTGCVPIPRHTGDLPPGTRRSIAAALRALGFFVLLLVVAAWAGFFLLTS